MTRPVTAQSLKNPDVTHWGFEGFWLGEDVWGDWIALPTGSKRWKGAEMMSATGSNAVLCAPRGEWWHLHYNGVGDSKYSAFIDIGTPPVWVSANRYETIDLDLDVAVHQDGRIAIEDEDEFEVHRLQYRYTEEMIRRAKEETDRVVALVRERQAPFFDVAEGWLARLTS